MSSAIAVLLIFGLGAIHVTRLRAAGLRADMWAAAALYAAALLLALMLASGLVVPSPLALVFRLFGGLTEWMRTF